MIAAVQVTMRKMAGGSVGFPAMDVCTFGQTPNVAQKNMERARIVAPNQYQ